MSNIELVERLCDMLICAQEVMRRQAIVLAQHGLDCMASERAQITSDIERLT